MTRWSWRPGAAWLDPEPVWSHQAGKMTRVGWFGLLVGLFVGSLIGCVGVKTGLVGLLINWLIGL